jgi:hypothetical protein
MFVDDFFEEIQGFERNFLSGKLSEFLGTSLQNFHPKFSIEILIKKI